MEFLPKLFNPRKDQDKSFDAIDRSVGFRNGSLAEDCYIYSPSIVLAINVALATRRPLLISGEPGSGKSSLARNAAGVLSRVYYERVVTSRTQATDLLWSFDALRRLSDSTAGRELPPTTDYVEPGSVWWAFDPVGASNRGGKIRPDPGVKASEAPAGAVLLLDEIDKADPDVPNDLLEPFGAKTFTVRETGELVKAQRDVLLIFTTNGERELPQAFLRRCVVLAIPSPTKEWFVNLARHKIGEGQSAIYDQVADKIISLREAAGRSGQQPPGAAEFLDALEACRELGIDGESKDFKAVMQATAWKQPDRPPTDLPPS